jgi:hypothetical protein
LKTGGKYSNNEIKTLVSLSLKKEEEKVMK